MGGGGATGGVGGATGGGGGATAAGGAPLKPVMMPWRQPHKNKKLQKLPR